MRQSTFNRAKAKRRQRKLRRERLKRQRSRRISPCGIPGWKESVKTVGGMAGGLAGFIELIMVICAL